MSEQMSQMVEPRIVNRNAFNVAGLRYAGIAADSTIYLYFPVQAK